MAYKALSGSMLAFVRNRSWDKIYSVSTIHNKSTSTGYFRVYQNILFEENECAPDLKSGMTPKY